MPRENRQDNLLWITDMGCKCWTPWIGIPLTLPIRLRDASKYNDMPSTMSQVHAYTCPCSSETPCRLLQRNVMVIANFETLRTACKSPHQFIKQANRYPKGAFRQLDQGEKRGDDIQPCEGVSIWCRCALGRLVHVNPPVIKRPSTL